MSRTSTHRRSPIMAVLVTTAAVAAVWSIAAAPSHAATPPPAAVCANTFTATITPGFTPTPGAGKISSNGQTGSMECFGTIEGQRISGPGTLGFVLKYSSGSCRGHTGTGRVHLIIPTTAGSQDMVGTLAVRRTALTVRVKARFPGMRYSGTGVVFPLLGDCASTPLEQVRVTMTGSLHETQRPGDGPGRGR